MIPSSKIPTTRTPPLYYHSFPTPNQWSIDSHSKEYRQQRKKDRVIARMDDLVRSLRGPIDDGRRKYLLCELFFTTNYWISNNCVGPTLASLYMGEPVAALRNYVQRALAKAFGCSRLMVPAVLQKHYGCSITAHGIYADTNDVPRSFEQRAMLEKFKVYFENGKALWNTWWTQADSDLVPVNTFRAYDCSGDERDHLRDRHGFFVMTLYRDLYVAPHRPTLKAFPKFHSTIPEGTAVQCSGSILIVEGKVKEITSASGHYKPDKLFFVNVLEQLKTVGVGTLKNIALYDYDNEVIAKNAEEYLKQYGRWNAVDERGRIISGARTNEAAAIRGQLHARRLEELTIGRTKDKALEAVFAEAFEKARQIEPGALWTKTWKGVLDDLIAFSGGGWYQKKKTEYQSKPPFPPPESKPPVPPRPKEFHFTPV